MADYLVVADVGYMRKCTLMIQWMSRFDTLRLVAKLNARVIVKAESGRILPTCTAGRMIDNNHDCSLNIT
jgi:hypothetical protein